jgi:hypothetical protein
MTRKQLAQLIAARVFEAGLIANWRGVDLKMPVHPGVLPHRIQFMHRLVRGTELGGSGFAREPFENLIERALCEFRVLAPLGLYDNCLRGYPCRI